jgi:hypothetical protein
MANGFSAFSASGSNSDGVEKQNLPSGELKIRETQILQKADAEMAGIAKRKGLFQAFIWPENRGRGMDICRGRQISGVQ